MKKGMAKRFSKNRETRDELQLPAILCQDACQRLMLHPYITASRTIVNIILSRGGHLGANEPTVALKFFVSPKRILYVFKS